MPLFRVWVALGALLGGLAVAGAAYAAHAPIDPARSRAVASAVQMQGWHALALLACGVWGASLAPGSAWPVHVAAGCFLVGVLLFGGAVWIPQFGGPSLGMTAPTGGTILMLGWLILAISAITARVGR